MFKNIYPLSLVLLFSAFMLSSCGGDDPDTSAADSENGEPVINSITPASAYRTDTIVISGKNFSTDKTKLEISFSGTIGTIVSSTATEIKVIIPLELFATSPTVFVNKGTFSVYSGNALTVLNPSFSFYQMLPKSGSPGQVVRVNGTGLPSNKSDITVTFNNGIAGIVTNAASTYFDVMVPQGVASGYFKITIGKRNLPSPSTFTVIAGGVWSPVSAYTGTAKGTDFLNGFTIGSEIFVGFGIQNFWMADMWKFNTTNKAWTKLTNFQGTPRMTPFTFVLNGIAYVGSGLIGYNNYASDFWSYDPAQDKWTQLTNFPGEARYTSASFTANGKGYVGLGYGATSGNLKDFWEFDPATKAWTKLADFPGTARTSACVFVIDAKAYVVGGFSNDYLKEVWVFDATSKTWLQKASLPAPRRESVAFSLTGKGVITGGYNFNDGGFRDTWVYDPALDKWSQHANFYGNTVNGSYATSVGTLGYVIGGQGNPDGTVYTFSF